MPVVNVKELDAIRNFRVALVKFAESGQVSLADADSDVLRTIHWLENEMIPHWATQIRKREEIVSRCKDAVRQKTLYKDATGRPQRADDEIKLLKRAEAMLVEAQGKFTSSKRYLRQIQHAQMEYRGQTQKLGLTLSTDLPNTVSKLGNLLNILEQYAAGGAPEVTSMAQAQPRDEAKDGGPKDEGGRMRDEKQNEVPPAPP